MKTMKKVKATKGYTEPNEHQNDYPGVDPKPFGHVSKVRLTHESTAKTQSERREERLKINGHTR